MCVWSSRIFDAFLLKSFDASQSGFCWTGCQERARSRYAQGFTSARSQAVARGVIKSEFISTRVSSCPLGAADRDSVHGVPPSLSSPSVSFSAIAVCKIVPPLFLNLIAPVLTIESYQPTFCHPKTLAHTRLRFLSCVVLSTWAKIWENTYDPLKKPLLWGTWCLI